MKTKKISFIKIVLLVILTINYNTTFGQIKNDQWAGFRGLENEGVTHCDKLPTNWSDSTNIKWKTFIPGSGYSSPIAYNDCIFLSTSFKTIKGSVLNKILQRLLFVVGTVVLILLTIRIGLHLSIKQNLRTLITNSLYSIIILFILLLLLFSENVFDYPRCDSRKWVGSSMFLFLSLFSCSFFIKKEKSSLKKILGFLIIATIPLFFYCMPIVAKEHLFRSGLMANNPRFLYFINLLYFIGALLIILNIVPSDNIRNKIQDKIKEKHNVKSILLRSHIFWILNLVLLLIVITIASKIIHNSEYLSYRFGTPLLKPVIGWENLIYLTLFWLILISIISFYHRINITNNKIQHWLKSLILILGVLYFIHTNFVSIKENHCRAIVSVNAINGNINWICEGLYAPLGSLNMNSPASPTLVADKNNIYGYFGSSGLFCCNYKGQLIWENKNLPFNSYYGVGTSPVLYKDKIIIVSDSPKKPFISVLNTSTGKEIWRKNLLEGLSNKTAGSSRTPLIKQFKDLDVIFVWRGNYLSVLNLVDGNEISNINLENGKKADDCVSSLISDSINIYLSKPDYCIAFNIENLIRGDSIPIWKKKINGSNIPTPIISNKLLFILNDRGNVTCLKPSTGDVLWKNRLSGRIYFSSPIANDEYVYFTDNYGNTSVIAVSEIFELISENKLNCEIRASIAPFKNKIYLRTYNELYCISEDEEITMGNKQDSERSARPSDESVLNYTRRDRGYAPGDRFIDSEVI